MYERSFEVDGHFVYRECRFPTTAVPSKAELYLSSIEVAIVETPKGLGNKKLAPSPGDVIVSLRQAAADEKGNWDFGDIPAGLFNGCEQCCVVLDKIQGLVRRGS